ncbi:MAG TPA: peptide ABC transporter substrate-binding protein [Sphingorhabdus sp.]|jgi:peptide/nickel transport system substrate-binding protein/oligopeptide transport system substrate-binding protein|uniref:peptide ABC transporter substrate-binding protein n=1 Tax=Sphingorhabdus sp. TaxID=1902408 RepID=UPI002BA4DCA7|nr:peptide ABC transporter substrate-binding protein [Sphingorhabdus sp.]HMT42446.1 peptide ABC transporter substrate-binding protein [Sphingorhabdus sp.]HMU20649.1 peptide ABC transporter substrate-binding protein [Sphingorhabdus sp.]
MRWLAPFLVFLLLSCGGGNTGKGSEGDAIVRLMEADSRGLDPQLVSDLASTRIAADLFEGLTRFDAKGEAEAGLAQSWQTSMDGRLWTFRLHPGLRFSDGQPLTAKVFEQAFRRIQDKRSGSPHGPLFGVIEAINASDAQTVVVRLKTPFPQLPALLAHPAMAALPFHRIEAAGERWAAERPLVTSGAYRLTEWRLSQQLTLEANPEWHGGTPRTQRVIWKPMENLNSAMRLVLAGGADIGSEYTPARYHWLREHHRDIARNAPFLGTYYFAFNTRKPPFDDVRVRQALSMAIDREWIASKMVDAGNLPAWGLLPPGLDGGQSFKPEWATLSQKARTERARKLLGQAGYGRGHPLRFEIRFNSSTEHRRAAVAMATMWRELGVEAKLLNSEASLHFDSLKRADFELARSGWIADLPAPENFLAVHLSNSGPQNYSGYANPDYDRAVELAMAEPDPKRRAGLMREAERILIADMPILPLYFYASRSLVSPKVRGWQDNPGNIHPSRTLWKVP